MHCLLYHIPYFISMYGSLKMFSDQGVEKNNNIVKMIHRRKSSKWDGPTDALKVRKRLEFAHQENVGRVKRQYNKQSDWWERDMHTTRSETRTKIFTEMENADNRQHQSVDFDKKSNQDLQSYKTIFHKYKASRFELETDKS